MQPRSCFLPMKSLLEPGVEGLALEVGSRPVQCSIARRTAEDGPRGSRATLRGGTKAAVGGIIEAILWAPKPTQRPGA
jgi:hypothetical protein